jgi:hypothetical protein
LVPDVADGAEAAGLAVLVPFGPNGENTAAIRVLKTPTLAAAVDETINSYVFAPEPLTGKTHVGERPSS